MTSCQCREGLLLIPLHCFDAFVRETQITLLSELRWCGPDVGYCPQHSRGKTRLRGGLRHPRDPHQRPLYLLSSPSFFPLFNLPTSTIAVSHPRLSRLSENCVCLPEERRRAEDVVPRRHLAFGSGSSGIGGGWVRCRGGVDYRVGVEHTLRKRSRRQQQTKPNYQLLGTAGLLESVARTQSMIGSHMIPKFMKRRPKVKLINGNGT